MQNDWMSVLTASVEDLMMNSRSQKHWHTHNSGRGKHLAKKPRDRIANRGRYVVNGRSQNNWTSRYWTPRGQVYYSYDFLTLPLARMAQTSANRHRNDSAPDLFWRDYYACTATPHILCRSIYHNSTHSSGLQLSLFTTHYKRLPKSLPVRPSIPLVPSWPALLTMGIGLYCFRVDRLSSATQQDMISKGKP